MTVLDEPRVWVPTDPHIGPDSDDLTLLAPTGDPAVDIGGAALAVHRVGAAACESVAREPLCDEYRLVEALSAARAAFADPLIDSISKSLGDEQYAGLLARDLFDDAEQTALGVYSACVSKGVAPPLAIQRAGLVYGVPAHDLGKYMAVASELKAHPIAIADAADRAVVRWASSVAREETAPTKINKKMDPEHFDRAVAQGRIRRGSGGRFVETDDAPVLPKTLTEALSNAPKAPAKPGTLEWLQERVKGAPQAAPPVEGAEPKTKEPKVAKRPKRAKQARVIRSQAPASITSRITSRIQSTLTSRVNAVLGSRLRVAQETQHKADTDDRFRPIDSLKPYEDYAIYGRLGDTMSWAVDAPTARSLVASFTGSTSGTTKVVRAGLLQELLGSPERWNSREHFDQLSGHVEGQQRDEIVVNSHRISATELENAGIPEDSQAVAAYAEREGYLDALAVDEGGRFNPLRKMWMAVAKDSNPSTGSWYVLALPEPKSTGSDSGVLEQHVPEVAEFVIYDEHGEVRGNVEAGPGGRHAEYILDKNQVYAVEQPTQLWDDARGAWVYRYHVRPARDSEFGKALTPQQRRLLTTDEPRDERGRWVETPHEALARILSQVPSTAEEAPPREAKQVRRARRARVVSRTQAPARLQSRVQSRIEAQLRPAQLQAMVRARAKVESERAAEGVTTLADDQIYRVYSPDAWNTLLRQTGWKGFADEYPSVIDVEGKALDNLMRRELVDGEFADSELRTSVHFEVEKQRGMKEMPSLARPNLRADDDAGWAKLYRNILDEMERDPSIAFAQLSTGKGHDDVRVLVNAEPVRPHILIIDDNYDADPDGPVKLTLVKEFQQSSLQHHQYVPERDDLRFIDRMSNAPLRIYRVSRADVKVYRADQ